MTTDHSQTKSALNASAEGTKSLDTLRFLDPCKSLIADAIANHVNSLVGSDSPSIDPTDIFKLLEKPPEEGMGDYALPCFRFAKPLKMPPPKIAESVANALIATGIHWIDKTTTVNAFCNIFINHSVMAAQTLPDVVNGKSFRYPIAPANTRERVMIEYSQPNTHKEFHVGHLRNVCLGSALIKMFRYCGYQVTAANYFGDEGAHIAKCLWMMRKSGRTPPKSGDKGAWLGEIYVEATKALDESSGTDQATAEQEISKILRGIESKNGEWYDLWLETRQWSLDAFKSIYNWVGAEFDRDFFESEVSSESQHIVDEYLSTGVFKEDQGAIGVDLSAYKLGFMIARGARTNKK